MGADASNWLAAVLLVMLVLTSALDFLRHPRALETTTRLRIPARMVPVLGGIKTLAAVGVILGLRNVRMAELTGACLVFYFAVATLAHFRAKDKVVNAVPAFVLTCVSLAYLASQFTR